jgi:hypothetical protein
MWLDELDRVGSGEQHRQAVAGLARRAALLAQHERHPLLAAIQPRRQLLRQLAGHPAELRAAGEHLDGVRIVLVGRIAPQLERIAGLDGGSDEGLRVVLSRPRDAGDVQPPLPGGLPAEIPPAGRIDELEPDQPDLPAIVRIPVALVVFDLDLHPPQAKGFRAEISGKCPM